MAEIIDVGTTRRKPLSVRERLAVYEREKGRCYLCGRQIRAGDKWICEHPRALELGGEDDRALLRVACDWCASEKTKDDHRRASKAKRQKSRHLGLKTARRPMPCGRDTPWKRTIDGKTVRRDA